ncbi:v-type proton ATPase 16 kDa proteolipid subunit 2 [Sticta canariensis]|nr:v-type proton ATPase 16 kDa proteolipid subunit 2 [Sticta canariensis]
MAENELTPKFAPFIGMGGIAFAMIFGSYRAGAGAAFGTAKAGIGIAGVGTFRPDLIMKSLIPVVMAGIIAVYSLVIAVLISGDLDPPPKQNYSLYKFVTLGISIPQENLTSSGHSGFLHLGAGLSVGLTGLAAGYAIGIVGDMPGRTILYVAIENLRRHGIDTDFRRGVGTVRASRVPRSGAYEIFF